LSKLQPYISKHAIQLAVAGTDHIAASDMIDGRIAAVRNNLNAFGFGDVSIRSYSAKFYSQLYGSFRDACNSTPNSNGIENRKSYQISPFNVNDAITSNLRDEEQGADILMAKPAALYPDIIAALKQQTLKPIAAYHVSGEYASIEAMVQQGFMQCDAAHA
jgi:porphobilinogen synthase